MIAAGFVRRGVVEDRNRHKAAIRAEIQSRLIHALDRVRVADAPCQYVVTVLYDSADLLVEIHELRAGNDAGVQRVQAVLHSAVIPRTQRRTCGWIDTINVLCGVEDGRPGAFWIRGWVVSQLLRHDCVPPRRLIAF